VPVRSAAVPPSPARSAIAARYRDQPDAMPADIGHPQVLVMEQCFHTDIFNLIDGRYTGFIIPISMTFAHRRFPDGGLRQARHMRNIWQ
jgi:hypothetical protein